ncbi:hypothetical protein A4D02_24980 [Niastella koreensis]|uniref:Uncharacterized protein n=2 Tax=Niastella koreensis TaxID=354356 RepID=G8TFY5_NIAKG|nr:hypothetical protein [Niastella koreensis]AEW00584.1 hypothetical protein Niako_4323 [Niastella koreensis GR20-10]OQP52444.1 hypothetical protein A4D02_24980 [Niastella koreensis]
MIAIKHMAFVHQKIKTLGTAIFSNDSRNILKFPTCLIYALEADEKGNVWFIVRKPFDDISDLDENCPAGLQFYNKNCNYHLDLFGTATIIADYKDDHETLIRFSTLTYKYHHCKKKRTSSYITRGIQFINDFFSIRPPLHLRHSLILK